MVVPEVREYSLKVGVALDGDRLSNWNESKEVINIAATSAYTHLPLILIAYFIVPPFF
jgi:hypothetical protein